MKILVPIMAAAATLSLGAAEPSIQWRVADTNLADYFDVRGKRAVLRADLRQRITWAQYNLVTDASFNEFQLIVCRRALADFGPMLRQQTLKLFHDSLSLFGVLGLDRPFDDGDALRGHYQPVFAQQAWYKRVS